MASDWSTSLKEINGIDLTNYIPQQRTYNSIVYVHKKFIEGHKSTEEKKEKVKLKKEKKNKLDKCQQFNADKNTEFCKDKTYGIGNDNNILEQTIRFAKNIAPLVIPPSEDRMDVFYKVKTAKKHKKKDKKPKESSIDQHDLTHEKEDPKKVIETYKKVRKESFSVRESVSHSSNNTLDDLNINQSLCCTFSEVSEKKYHKKEKNHSKRLSQVQKLAISDSFEAVATENATRDAKIKIHLMTDKEKHFLSDSIKEPVLNAIKDCIAELNNCNVNADITTMQKILSYNSEKLDNILDKLTYIENKIYNHEKQLDIQGRKFNIQKKKMEIQESRLDGQANMLDSHEKRLDIYEKELKNTYEKKLDNQISTKNVLQPKVQDYKQNNKASTLEELGEDLVEIKEEYSSEEELHNELLDKRSAIVVELEEEYRDDIKMEALGGGEVPRSMKGSSSVGAKLERPNRIPTRFCWTDASRKK